MRTKNKLEKLLLDYDKAEQLHTETEALKPKLEAEIEAALAEGDALDENVARALQTKRAQLDLIPGKLKQIESRKKNLEPEILEEFRAGWSALNAELRSIGDTAKENLRAKIAPALAEMDNPIITQLIEFVFNHTKIRLALAECESRLSFPNFQNEPVLRAQKLILSEKQLVEIKKTLN